jgi:hypothetical protein
MGQASLAPLDLLHFAVWERVVYTDGTLVMRYRHAGLQLPKSRTLNRRELEVVAAGVTKKLVRHFEVFFHPLFLFDKRI